MGEGGENGVNKKKRGREREKIVREIERRVG